MLVALAILASGSWFVFWLWPSLMRRFYTPERRFDEVVYTVTDDRRRLPLYHYRPRGDGPPRRHPVILCPGLGSNRYSFDLSDEAPSLALNLAERGFDVYVVELRGEGHGDHESTLWDFDTFVQQDAPTLVDQVRELTGAPTVFWVGHSMGGMVLLAATARGMSGVRAGVTLGSTLNFHGTDHAFGPYLRMRPVLERLTMVPYGWLSRLVAPFAARWLHNPLDELNFNVANADPVAVRRLDAVGFTAMSPRVVLQLLTATEPGGLHTRGDVAPRYPERLAARRDPPPILMMAGEGDLQCPFPAVERIAQTQPRFRTHMIGPSTGAEKAYGHFDTLLGVRAADEVYPHIIEWLEAHDLPAEADASAAA